MELMTRRSFIRAGMGATAGMLLPGRPSTGNSSSAAGKAEGARPNIIMILADDMGFSDIGCYGSEIHTPNLDRMAAGGLRFSQFYNNPRCCPSRACLLTGLYPHQVGFGLMTAEFGESPSPAYKGDLSDRCVTIAEALRPSGYHTAMCGKWHLTPPALESKRNWPLQRGFEKYFGTIAGASSYFDPATLTRDNSRIRAGGDFYYTDAIAKNAVQYIDDFGRTGSPFFLYVAFTSPHWPLHALAEDIAKYQDRYRTGWDELRAERHQQQINMGMVKEEWGISRRDSRVPPWELARYQEWEMHRMAVYAAQVDRMDQGIGKILTKLQELGIEKDTLIMFMSDNGGNFEEISGARGANVEVAIHIPHETFDGRLVRVGNDPAVMPGTDDTYQSYGIPWGNVSNTPFRLFKHYAHEGGISTPLVAYWPAMIRQGNTITPQVGHEMDIMATCLDAAGVDYPKTYEGREVIPLEGKSLLPVFQGKEREGHKTLFWEHEGNSAVRMGKWKLVSKYPDYWELYDLEADRTEMHDLADADPHRLKEMASLYGEWAQKVGALPWPVPGIPSDVPGIPKYLRR